MYELIVQNGHEQVCTVQKIVYRTVNFYYCTALPIIRTVLIIGT